MTVDSKDKHLAPVLSLVGHGLLFGFFTGFVPQVFCLFLFLRGWISAGGSLPDEAYAAVGFAPLLVTYYTLLLFPLGFAVGFCLRLAAYRFPKIEAFLYHKFVKITLCITTCLFFVVPALYLLTILTLVAIGW